MGTRTSFVTTKGLCDVTMDNDQDFNFLSDVSPETFESIRSKIKEAILLTDMSLHNSIVEKTKNLIKKNNTSGTNDDNCGDLGNNNDIHAITDPSLFVLMY